MPQPKDEAKLKSSVDPYTKSETPVLPALLAAPLRGDTLQVAH
eukprot:CAMPEP_0185764488 /NCGR_PEP_ID=MMETSP1174-20130828/23436_1 /TAXON_ID=35687 /ORGANISM="Dictyocha speculum, Strain CCMP1381" /LENGTH=42 /DNA_ID= /DNA_START= /DNA_END= /DNA_ORIENTATION=